MTPTTTRRPSVRVGLLALWVASAAAVAGVAPALAARDDIVLISRATGATGAPVDAFAGSPSVSADGGRVAFDSAADGLSPDDVDTVTNVYVRDAVAGTTELVSRATGATGAGGTGDSSGPSISGDGRFVAFNSDADNLSSDDVDTVTNVYVRDLVTGATTLVSRASGATGAGADARSTFPDISDDGRFVSFRSDADNLSPDDDDAVTNIYVRDLVAGTTTLVSRKAGATGAAANDDSFNAAISGNGNRVAFESNANNLSDADLNGVENVFVRDVAAATVVLVSRGNGVGGAPGNGDSGAVGISSSGRFVAFQSDANNLSTADDNTVTNVFLRDLDAATTALVSRATGAGGAGGDAASADPASRPVVSDNARVSFVSEADNLSADDDDALVNVFVRDALAGTTELVSRAAGPAGVAANATSSAPAISSDGRYVAFVSPATNLVTGAAAVPNVYRRDLLGDAPVASPACKTLPLPPAPSGEGATFTLTVTQLRINQRISQAAIRRLHAVEARLDGGLSARDLCGYSVGPGQLGPGILTATAAASLAPVAPADPAPIIDPGRTGAGDPITLSAGQLLINQRIDQAAIRRAAGIGDRLDAGLTGGDVRAGQVTQGKLYDRLQVLSASATAEPAASATVIPGRLTPADPGSVTLSVAQLQINQRIAQAGVRNANALIRRLETGLAGSGLRAGTLTAADLG